MNKGSPGNSLPPVRKVRFFPAPPEISEISLWLPGFGWRAPSDRALTLPVLARSATMPQVAAVASEAGGAALVRLQVSLGTWQ